MKRQVSEQLPLKTLDGVPSRRSPCIAWRNSLICRSAVSLSPVNILSFPLSGGGAPLSSEGNLCPFAGQLRRSSTWDFGVLSCRSPRSPSFAAFKWCDCCEAGVVGQITDVPGVVRAKASGGGSGCLRSGTLFWSVHARNPSRLIFDEA